MIEVIAHRGFSGAAPENTLAAFEKAIATGADGVEFDVQASRDGTLLVIHDEELGRTAGGAAGHSELVKDTSLAELKELDAGSWFDAAYAAERIPLLSEALELLRPTALSIHIELKTRRFPYPGLVAGVVGEVREMGLAERTVLSSYNHHSLIEARALAPEVACAALFFGHALEPWEYAARHGFQALHPSEYAVTQKLVDECHARALALRAWTVDERERALALMEMGVDGIITNQPARLLAWRAG